ncbi:hypothetical protein [Siminovitchia terrae]|uniref:hypothetical protein n=1 Tax=Siminovitchia terrae TaxID=1914933 RepID=UPI0028A8AEFF|nr:hypothetical protein [Siminovitchia terrae]
MESLLRKSAIYGFFIGIGAAILFVKYAEVENIGDGATLTNHLPMDEYIITVLRFGVVASILGLVCGLILLNKKK